MRRSAISGVCVFFALTGCEDFPADFLQSAVTADRFAYATLEDADISGRAGTPTVRIGAINPAGVASPLGRFQPVDERADLLEMQLSHDATYVAVDVIRTIEVDDQRVLQNVIVVADGAGRVQEEFTDVDLVDAFLAGCDPTAPNLQRFLGASQDLINDEITAGNLPSGSVAAHDWTMPNVNSASIKGWNSDDTLWLSFGANPGVAYIAPGATDPEPLRGFVNPFGTTVTMNFEFSANGWSILTCTMDSVSPGRPPFTRDIELTRSHPSLPDGVILLDGSELFFSGSTRIVEGAIMLDGALGN